MKKIEVIDLLDSSSEEEDNNEPSALPPAAKKTIAAIPLAQVNGAKKDVVVQTGETCSKLLNGKAPSSIGERESSPIDAATTRTTTSKLGETSDRPAESKSSSGETDGTSCEMRSYQLLSDRAKCCWVCSEDLQTDDGEFCLYRRHPHPLIPPLNEDEDDEDKAASIQSTVAVVASVCGACGPALVDNDSDEELCALCLKSEEDGDMFFLCDGEDCTRMVCETCVAVCNGGGEQGGRIALLQRKSKDLWLCPVCKPPPTLYKTPSCNAPDRTVEMAFQELDLVETEHRKTLEELDQKDEKRQEIAAELASDATASEEDIEDEFQLWLDKMDRHQIRLSDTISHLQDEIEVVHRYDLTDLYKKLRPDSWTNPTNGDEAWVRIADEVVKRQAEERAIRLANQSEMADSDDNDDDVYSCYDDVEELAAEDSVLDPEARNKTVRSFPPQIQVNIKKFKKSQELAIQAEKEKFERNQIPVKKVSEDFDLQLMKRPRNEFRPRVVARRRNKSKSSSRTTASRQCGNGTSNSNKERKFDSGEQMKTQIGKEKSNQEGNDRGHEDLESKGDGQSDGQAKIQTPGMQEDNVVARASAAATIHPPPTTLSPSRTSDTALQGQNSKTLLKPKKRADLQQIQPGNAQFAESFFEKDCIFHDSSLVLPGPLRVAVSREVAEKLKAHQTEAVNFIWKNAFADCMPEPSEPGGCLLAHNMGLGKSLAAIALIQAVVLHKLVRKVLLVVPVNTARNWRDEFDKWIGKMSPSIEFNDLKDFHAGARSSVIKRWHRNGGVLLTSSSSLLSFFKANHTDECSEHVKSSDLLVIDEAHECLKGKATKVSNALLRIQTTRKIALTGTPLQNNLLEYYRIISFLRPGLLPQPESLFEREYVEPIDSGLTKNCTKEQLETSRTKTEALHKILDPIVHRKGPKELSSELPPMQQVVLYLRPSRLQSRLYRWFKKWQDTHTKNFFAAFSALRPILNHPGGLLFRKNVSDDKDKSIKSGAEDELVEEKELIRLQRWWDSVTDKIPESQLSDVSQGYKIVLLLHILVLASRRNEKVVIFSQCLKTLDFVEHVLGKDWLDACPSLSKLVDDSSSFRGWQRGKEFLRIDGGTSSSDRGDSVDEFRENDNVRAFLLSKAGSVGINLVAANRVVLLDTHFNPAISEQAIYRLHRYGQEKPVFVYRLLAQSSMEDKVYMRSVTKTGLALRVIDKKNVDRYFTAKEMADLQEQLTWVECDKCKKWRVLPEAEADLSERQWYCEMNTDPQNNTCEAPERDQLWYENEELKAKGLGNSEGYVASASEEPEVLSAKDKDDLLQNDEILQQLLKVTATAKSTAMVAKHDFHDIFVKPKDDLTKFRIQTHEKTSSPAKVGTNTASPSSRSEKRQATVSPLATPRRSPNTRSSVKPSLNVEACKTPRERDRKENINSCHDYRASRSLSPNMQNGKTKFIESSTCEKEKHHVGHQVGQKRKTAYRGKEDLSTAESSSTSLSRRSLRCRKEPERFDPGAAPNRSARPERPLKSRTSLDHPVSSEVSRGNKAIGVDGDNSGEPDAARRTSSRTSYSPANQAETSATNSDHQKGGEEENSKPRNHFLPAKSKEAIDPPENIIRPSDPHVHPPSKTSCITGRPFRRSLKKTISRKSTTHDQETNKSKEATDGGAQMDRPSDSSSPSTSNKSGDNIKPPVRSESKKSIEMKSAAPPFHDGQSTGQRRKKNEMSSSPQNKRARKVDVEVIDLCDD
ncbi:hypothetical protein ACA910_006985 [Epithemia clementina (nom. ined.)]